MRALLGKCLAASTMPLFFRSLLAYADSVADPGHYNSIAGLAPFHYQTLYPLDNLLASLQDLLPHRSNRLQDRLLHNNRVDGNLVLGSLLLNLKPLSPNTPNSRTN